MWSSLELQKWHRRASEQLGRYTDQKLLGKMGAN